MGKKRWHKRLSVAVLAAILAVNYGGANISARAAMVSPVEESIQAEVKGLTASPSDAEKTEKTEKTNAEKEKVSEAVIATPSDEKKPESTKLPEISAAVKETGSAMYADAAEDIVYTISHATDGFSVSGGELNTNVTTLTEAVKQILDQSKTKKVAIHFDNIVSLENDGIQLNTPCELTLTGSYKAEGSWGVLFKINNAGRFTIHNTADITTSKTAITNSKGAEVIFEHNGGTLENSTGGQLFNLKTNDKVYLKGGTINGTVFGSGGYVEISDGVWNGSLSSVKEVKMIGGRLENCKADTSSIYAIRGAEKISINGGEIYAENTNTNKTDSNRAAYAISMANNTQLTLSGDVNISASCDSEKQGSLYYYSGAYPTVNATGLTSVNSGFTLAPYYSAMTSSSALTNWMECSNNIQSLLGKMKLNVICPTVETQAEYANYELKAAGNYIRILDKNAPVSQIEEGVIKKADIQQSTEEGKYDVTVTYAPGGEGTEENKKYQYDITSGSVSGILNDILLMNTGAAGPQITIGSTASPISEDITIDTAGFSEENAVILEGKINGRVTVTGKGTLKSSLSCSGFVGATSSTIHITGGEIIGESTNSPVIRLRAANLIVEGDNTVIRNANQSSGSVESHDTISATGGVQITIRGGTIGSSGGRALYIYRKGDSALADSYASLLIEGGTITGAKYGIYNTEHNEVTIKGGTIKGTESDIFLAHDITQISREPKKFTVENESSSKPFPFAKMQIENLSNTNEIDFTKAKLNEADALNIVLNSGAEAGKLFRVSTEEYRSFLKAVRLSGPAAPVCVVYNSDKPSASQNTTDIYVFPKTGMQTVHVKYYNEYTDTEPFYDEYLLKGYTVKGADLISSYLSKTVPSGTNQAKFSVWRYKDDIRKGTAADETITVNQLVDDRLATEENNAPVVELYAGYKVSLTGSSSVNGDSSISFQATSDGTTLYYTENPTYSTYSGEELRAAAKAENTRGDFQSLSSEDGNFTISCTNLEPGQSYSCIMVAENANFDVSDALKLTATTNTRVLNKEDFSIGETRFTYAGNQATHGVSVTPTSENSGKFEIDMVRYKLKEGEKYTGGFLGEQALAGEYGVFVSTKSEASGINRVTDLFLCDMTIEKADFDPSWFKTFSKITYGQDAGDALKPVIREEYSTTGATAIITGYGEISYKLYEDATLTKEVSRNSEGHYDVCLKEGGTVGQYYVGVTCTEGNSIKAQETPAAIFNNQLTIEKADYTFSGLTCENIYYGESPAPGVNLQKADANVAYTEANGGPVRFTYTNDSTGSSGAAWSVGNNAGTWYVRAEIDESRNFKGAKSEWKAFTVNKAELKISVKTLDSKTYDGTTTASGTLSLEAVKGKLLSADEAELGASGVFTWTSPAAGTNTVKVSEIKLTGAAKDNYCIEAGGDSLTGISCQDAQIIAAKLTGVSVTQTESLTYNGRPQVANVAVKATTVDGKAAGFVYGLTAEQAADPATAFPTVPAFTDAGEHRVYYVASASDHEPETGSFIVTILKAQLNGVGSENYTGVYDGRDHGISVTLSAAAEGGTIFYGETEGECKLTENPLYRNAGTYTVYYEVSKDNYITHKGQASVTIHPAELTVTAEPKTVTYKEAPPVYSSKISGLVPDDTEEALEGEITYLCDYAVGKDVGEYKIVPSGLTAKNGNYTIAYIPGTLNVTQAAPELSIENLSALDRVYDAAALEPEVRSDSDGALTVTFMKGNEVIPNAPAAVGSYRVIVNTEATKNYLAGNKEFSFEIRKAPLTVTAKDLRIPVKSEIPEYEAVYEGFAGADNAASLGGNLQFTCSYTKESAVGTYEIMPYGLTSKNYELHFVGGTLTVEGKSGGGGSSSGGSSNNDSTIIDRPDKDNPTTPTTAKTKTVKADSKGNVVITKSMVSDAISTAQADAKKNGNTANGIAVVVPAEISKMLNGVQITLKADALDKLVSSGVKRFTTNADRMADFGFTLDTLKMLDTQSQGGDLILRLTKTAVTSAEAKAAIGNRPAYDITLWYLKDGKETSVSLNGKTVSVAIPYAPAKGESIGNLYAVYVDGSGKVQWITKSSYDADQKAVIFEAKHFSIYGVGYKNPVPNFTDINGHWAKEHILFTVSRGLFSGTSETTFSPNTTLTRGMFVTALGRLAGINPDSYKTGTFIDVKADAYYAPYVNWAASKGIVSGTTFTTFAPDSKITREQMAVIMKNYADKMGYSIPKTLEAVTFADNASISSWAKEAVKAMQQAGILSGKSNNQFDPKGNATRVEAATVLHRFVEVIIDPQTANGWVQNDSGE